jgi:hypothetical protein
MRVIASYVGCCDSALVRIKAAYLMPEGCFAQVLRDPAGRGSINPLASRLRTAPGP